MDVLRSLITPGCLVRTPDGRHGAISAFDARTNIALVHFTNAEGFTSNGELHFTKLRAGNDETEQLLTGKVTKEFPKVGWSSDQNRVLARPDYRRNRVLS